jgi:hypothetical protein
MIPMTVLMGLFIAIGLYWAILTRHFLDWTTRYNESFHRRIDSPLAQPVLVPRAQDNYARLQANGGMVLFTWAIRFIGIAMIGCALVTVCRIIVYGF